MKLYNTLTRQKEEFVTLEPGKVKMYACGPTVYNYFHLGNARPFITFDTLRRYLEYRGYDVMFCQNFTDIDDKMIAKANQEGITVKDLADRFIQEYYTDADGLNILRPTFQPRATESMDEIIFMIEELVKKGLAYELEDGVYFEVAKFDTYGKLSHLNRDDLKEGAGERGTHNQAKRNYMDFALWKKARPEEPFWPSPWGDGRPGWHIECSAMIGKYLGETIDIHAGGQDLVFPHHENEIAQSEGVNEAPLARFWVHNGFINVDNEKMSKSAGNFFTVRDIVSQYDYRIIRFFILSGHYRMPINFSSDLLQAAANGLERIDNCFSTLTFVAESRTTLALEDEQAENLLLKSIEEAEVAFVTAMDDDLNTADAITAIFELVRVANSHVQNPGISARVLLVAADKIRHLTQILGISLGGEAKEQKVPQEVLELVDQRVAAKAAKNFALADELRDQVHGLGYQIKDTPQGPQVQKI